MAVGNHDRGLVPAPRTCRNLLDGVDTQDPGRVVVSRRHLYCVIPIVEILDDRHGEIISQYDFATGAE